MQGASITISSVGGVGGTAFTPIIKLGAQSTLKAG